MLPRLLLALLSILAVSASNKTGSRLSYDEKMLKKVVRLEQKLKQRDESLREWEAMMENTLTELEQKKKTIWETIATTDHIVSEIDSDVTAWDTAFQKQLDSHDLTVQSLLENHKTPIVLFKARLVLSRNIVKGKALVFTEVIANAGDGYDDCTGYFTAPVPGTYMFTAQLCSPSTGVARVYIVANGTKIELTTYRGKYAAGECMTLTGVSVLDEGEQASVQGSGDNVKGLIEMNLRWNTFSGILINILWENSYSTEHK